MPTDVIMPALGLAQETGTVVQWIKRAGDRVVKGEPLLEVETDKAVVEVESPASGTLAAISAEAGAEVPVGTAIALILGHDESEGQEDAPLRSPGVEVREQNTSPLAGIREQNTSPLAGEVGARSAPGGGVEELLTEVDTEARLKPASPRARRLAAENEVDLAAVTGTGPGGAVVSADLPETSGESELEVGRTWRIMAERTAAAWAAPHFYLTREVAAEPLLTYRAGLAGNREMVTMTDLLVRVSALTLKRHPHLCSAWRQGRLVKASRISIGVAVAGEDGLTVPVLHDADRRTLAEISAWREGAVERARSHRLRPEDLEGGVFTISNLGMHGVDAFTAIINGGQASILAVGRIAERAVARRGRVEAAQTMILTLGCDHRVVDGARGALFLKDLVAALEEPSKVLG
jgi:pyruvate dehydrogenase E2 component (dihydrolipoamide acetyltransferase)